MIHRVLELATALRRAGIPIAVTDTIDAAQALAHLPLDDKEVFRSGLASLFVKSESHRPTFDTLFDIHFAPRRDDEPLPEDTPSAGELRAELAMLLATGEERALSNLAARAVAALGRVEGSASGGLYYQYPVLRALDVDGVVIRVARDFVEEQSLSSLERRLLADEVARRADAFRDAIAREVRARGVEQRGAEAVAQYAVRPLPQDIDFLRASGAEIAAMRRTIAPLARKLAARAAFKQRRARHGRLDLRGTIRRSMSTGGVPFGVHHRKRHPHRPDLFVLCDVSSSVASFSRFSLMLVHALQNQFARVRSFAFVDDVTEITAAFRREDLGAALEALGASETLTTRSGHSDYGAALERWGDMVARDVGPKTTILILGDARNNNRRPRAESLTELRDRARRTFWLNPEPLDQWDTGDSLASLYAAHTDRMAEVRNLRQLEEFISTLL